jgi:outer membrane immunogenic protein
LTGDHINSREHQGWFIGAGDEYCSLPLAARLVLEDRASLLALRFSRRARVVQYDWLADWSFRAHRFDVQTVRSELVYRFNWGGAVVARY